MNAVRKDSKPNNNDLNKMPCTNILNKPHGKIAILMKINLVLNMKHVSVEGQTDKSKTFVSFTHFG
jgi:hypothetical protein